ncbi:MAG: hypothetical protein ACI9HK_005162, partial [Pirellulaceae bacterium]
HLQLHIGAGTIPFASAANYPDEFLVGPMNEVLLRRIAAVSGGTYDVEPAEVFTASDKVALQSIPIWSYLAGLACLVFVVEIATRRLLRPQLQPRKPTLMRRQL